jgi:hypothetical protein
MSTDLRTLTRHREIQEWVGRRHGMPAVARVRDEYGSMRHKLLLRFNRVRRPSDLLDDGASPVSWSAWLAELDRQQLALRVSADNRPTYEFIERAELN